MASAEEIRLIHESKIIYCCKNSLDSALTSGLIGGMQKYGYTEANKQASLAAFVKVGNILADGYGNPNHFQEIVGSDLGITIWLGVNQIMGHFGGVNQANLDVMASVAKKLEDMEVASLEETFRAQSEHAASDDGEDEREKAKEEAEKKIRELGGPFSGSGQHEPGLWAFGSCVHPG